MSDLVAISYDSVATATEVAANVIEQQKAHTIQLDDLVVVERQQDGKVKLHQPSAAGAGAAGGALWGGLIGLIFFMPLLGMAIGAASGATAGALSDYGVDDNFMKELGANLEPRSGRADPADQKHDAGQVDLADQDSWQGHPELPGHRDRRAAVDRARQRPRVRAERERVGAGRPGGDTAIWRSEPPRTPV